MLMPYFIFLFNALSTSTNLINNVVNNHKNDNGDGDNNDCFDANLEIFSFFTMNFGLKTTFLEDIFTMIHCFTTNNVLSSWEVVNDVGLTISNNWNKVHHRTVKMGDVWFSVGWNSFVQKSDLSN